MDTLKKPKRYFFGLVAIYMITGIGGLVMGTLWLRQSVEGAPRDAVISREIEKAGTFIGGFVAATSLIGYVGGIAPVRRKRFLIAFAWLIVAAMIAELGLGGVIWFKTLRMRSFFTTQWSTWSDSLKIAFQDMTNLPGYGQCCGYLDGDSKSIVVSGACTTQTISFPGCEEKVSAFADSYLRKLYTSLFGFTVVNVICFVSTVILVQARNDEERYIRIGRKEGRTYKNLI
ncbi:phospholipid scramblase 1 [Entomortierella chlamydospora]|uniref:Phospholipid scramblase 1 n=1 Tax=Entomortierella chlamydospora TaxID=101097 RepID=A0A9P6T3Y5_9FUNG|nr:phospholipid scramblase 1 [Entomortierella chlamydospora]KAG0023423.1 phospholipid scramblase 1 [Entomortierella chlamydospora]